MSLYRPKRSPYWHFDFQIAGYRFSGSTGERRKGEAAKVAADERRAAERLVAEIRRSGRQPLTLKAACDRWWDEVGKHLAETDLKPKLEWLAETLGPRKALHEICDDDIARAVAARRGHVVRSGTDADGRPLYRPISARTVNRTVTLLLKRVMRRAAEGWNAVILRWPKWRQHLLKQAKRPVREVTLAEEAAIAEAERGDYAALREFATITGLRLSESLLTWPQVDFENATVRIVGKGGEPRTVPLSRRAYEILWAERGRHSTHVFTFVALRTTRNPKNGERYERGRRYPITGTGLTSHRRLRWAKAGVKARWHDLRHTTGMRTLRTTGNLKLVQRTLGHASISTTSEFYADALVDDVREGMEAVAESRTKSRTTPKRSDKALDGR